MTILWVITVLAILALVGIMIANAVRRKTGAPYVPLAKDWVVDATKEAVKVVAKESTSEIVDLMKQAKHDHEKNHKSDKS